MTLRDFQQDLVNRVYAAWREPNVFNVLMTAPTGAGKCLARGTPILMHDGTIRTVENVRVGDILCGPTGSPRVVVSTATGNEMLYRIMPAKGESHTVNESHVLSLYITPNRPNVAPKIINMSVRDYLYQNKTFKHRAKLWRSWVEWPTTSFKLDPYFVGLWLGDGNADGPAISKPDPEVYCLIQQMAAAYELDITTTYGSTGCPTHKLVRRVGSSQENPVTTQLRALNLINNKHVPLTYKRTSISVRLQILAGLMDSDGHLSKSGFDFISISRTLADDVVFLARSVGLAAYVAKCEKSCQTGAVGIYWRVFISGDCSAIPTRIARKRAPRRKQKKNPLVTGFAIEPLGKGEYFGFELMGPDRLFLLGDFTVTHNTVIFGQVVKDFNAPACVIAHRQELVTQASLALNRDGIQHDVIVPKATKDQIIRAHHDLHGHSHYRGGSIVRVAGVDTLVRDSGHDRWYSQVALVVHDEAHHLQRENKWGKAHAKFPNARGLGVTAHCLRGDGRGLGRGSDGLADSLVVGPDARYLINRGFLTDYRLFCPSSDIDFSDLQVGPSGDFSQVKLAARTHASNTIVGDVVRKYLELAPGKLGVTFAVDIEAAKQLAAAYNAQGVPAEIITADTPISIRSQFMRQFRSRALLQLVSVDCLGEGVDVPAIEVVSMVRKTASFQLFAQQFGRALRTMVDDCHASTWGDYSDEQRRTIIAQSTKPAALVIDHVGNTIFHGLPDVPRTYSLDRAESRARAKTGVEALRACPDCTRPYERFHVQCPYCGFQPIPRARSTPEQVEGDIIELSPDVLAQLRAAVGDVDGPAPPRGTDVVGLSIRKNHRLRQHAQYSLRRVLDLWGVWRHHVCGESVRDMQRRFWCQFNVDVLTACALGAREAAELEARIRAEMSMAGINPPLELTHGVGLE